MAMAADGAVSFRGVPTKFPCICTGAETWYKGSLIWQLAAGNCTNVWAASLSFLGISPYKQVIAAGGTGIVFLGPFVATFHVNATAALAAGDEGDDLGMATAGSDDWLDVVKYTTGIGVDTASKIGRLLRFESATKIHVAIKPPWEWGVAKAGTEATLFTP